MSVNSAVPVLVPGGLVPARNFGSAAQSYPNCAVLPYLG